jgi:ADP-dependent phosphofructokinase/glucokinase
VPNLASMLRMQKYSIVAASNLDLGALWVHTIDFTLCKIYELNSIFVEALPDTVSFSVQGKGT